MANKTFIASPTGGKAVKSKYAEVNDDRTEKNNLFLDTVSILFV